MSRASSGEIVIIPIPASNVGLCAAGNLHKAKQQLLLNAHLDGVTSVNGAKDMNLKAGCLVTGDVNGVRA